MTERLPSVDLATLRLPQGVRAQLANEMADPSTEVGASLIATFVSFGSDPESYVASLPPGTEYAYTYVLDGDLIDIITGVAK